MEILTRKNVKKRPKKIDLYGPSFDFSDLLFRLSTLKATHTTNNNLYFRDNQNYLPLYRPYATKISTARQITLSRDFSHNYTEDESITKHRRQSSQNIEEFKLKPIKVHLNSKTKYRNRSRN